MHRLHSSEGNCCSGLRGIVVTDAAAAAAEGHQSKVTIVVLWLKTIWAEAALGRALFLLIRQQGLRVTQDDTSGSDRQGREEIWLPGVGNGSSKSGEDAPKCRQTASFITNCTGESALQEIKQINRKRRQTDINVMSFLYRALMH